MAKILVVEDDVLLSELILEQLTGDHHVVEITNNGREGLERLNCFKFDLLLLDWELPELSGPDILKAFRSTGGNTPVLMMTRRGSVDDKEVGFNSGTDDYLTKPFSIRELSMRVKALLRRQAVHPEQVFQVATLALNVEQRTCTQNGQPIKLLPKEFALMEFFMRHPDRVFSAQELLNSVWSSDSDASEEAVSICIRRLRKKIDTPGKSSLIANLHGVGYKLQSTD